jgi:DNA-binding NtrC family response regulator
VVSAIDAAVPGSYTEVEIRTSTVNCELHDISPAAFTNPAATDGSTLRRYSRVACADAFKRELIEHALRDKGGDPTAAAARLGLSRTQLYALIKKFNLKS